MNNETPKAKLTVLPPWVTMGYPRVGYRYHWELTWRGIYFCSEHKTDGYASKASAKRAALHAAGKLGLEVEEVEER